MARFSKSFLNNKLFTEQSISFDSMGEINVNGESVKPGVSYQESGDIDIKLYLPNAENVRMNISVSNNVFADIDFKNTGSGIFEGTVPFNNCMTGPANVKLFVNNIPVIVPDLPVIWTDNRPQNNLEIPDENDEYLLIKDVPHGSFIRDMFYSDYTHGWEHCMVFTPAEYNDGTSSYPVLYLLNGGGDNEIAWEYVGKMSHILDNLWAEEKAEKFIVVMMNGMLRANGWVGTPVDETFENMLLRECIPFIESHYRVNSSKWCRAIAGLSMGAYMSCDISFAHPDIFGSVGTFTASMNGDIKTTYKRPYPAFIEKGAENFGNCFKLYFRSTTPQENHPEFFEEDDKLLADSSIDKLPCYHRILYPSSTSKWNSWRMGLHDFAQLLFKN